MKKIVKKIIKFFLLLMFLTISNFINPSLTQDKKLEDIKISISKQDANLQDKDLFDKKLTDTKTTATLEKNNINNIKEEQEKKDIYLNFENTEISNFINYMAELKKINLVPDKALTGVKVSLTIREPLSLSQAWKVFLTVLEMGGFSIVQVGDVHEIIPKKSSSIQPLPAYINVPLDTLPESDARIRYVTILQNINVNEIQGLIKSMLSPEHQLVPYSEINGLIITDKSYNIKSAMKVIQELDQTGLQETVEVIQLKQANAMDVKSLFESLMRKQDGNPLARLLGRQSEGTLEYFSPTTRIIAEERTNSLILLGNKKSIKVIEDFIVNNIDKELKTTESPLHIYELQYIDAEQAKEILESVTESGEIQQAAKYGAVRGGVKYFKKMRFQVDKEGNRLIVSSTDKEDWKLLKKTIKDLDKPQPQVGIEALFITVNIDDLKGLGGAVRNKNPNQIGKGINFQSPTLAGTVTNPNDPQSLLGNMINGITYGLGTSTFTFGKGANIWGFFQALKSLTSTSILSQPFFTVANKTKATIIVGSSVNIAQETTASAFSGYKYIDANTTLNITPQINLDGMIRLNIDVAFTEFTDITLGNKNTKALKTDVSVADGQTLVLGGFVRTKVTEGENKTPLLGNIPILGWFFKTKQREVTKDYVFLFISPTIIKPKQIPGSDLYTRMKLHSATNDVEDAVQTKKGHDPIHDWFFNPDKEDYSHKVVDFANARYQPTTVDIKNDPYYRAKTTKEEKLEAQLEKSQLEESQLNKTGSEKAAQVTKEKNQIIKKEKLKNLISTQPDITQPEKKEPKIDTEKRDNLKNILKTEINSDLKPEEVNKKLAINSDFIELQDKLKKRKHKITQVNQPKGTLND